LTRPIRHGRQATAVHPDIGRFPMSARLSRNWMRCLALGVAAVTLAVVLTAPAEGHRRLSQLAVSDPNDGTLTVCRDGMRFEVVGEGRDPAFEPQRPTQPSIETPFAVYSPPPALDPLTQEPIGYPDPAQFVGATKVAEGTVTLLLQPAPIDFDPNDGGIVDDYLGRQTVRWSGGQLLPPGQASLFLDVPGGAANPYYDIVNCLLFPTEVRQCLNGGWRDFGFRNLGECIAFVVKARICKLLESVGLKPKFCPPSLPNGRD
jgi:hypothetical protein